MAASSALLAAATGLLLSCGQRTPPPAPVVAPVPPNPPASLAVADVAGDWRWSRASEQEGLRQIEVEHWHLQAQAGARIAGSYERVVTFLAKDGVPFTCNQDLGYTLRAMYRVEGVVRDNRAELREIAYETAPSPCDTGFRSLTRYGVARRNDNLVLRWPTGEQTLQPDKPGDTDALATRAAVGGTWRWQSRNQHGDEVRVEIEDWDLSETAGGALSGTVVRTVTVFDERGRRYECSGDTYYRYRDRYTVRGYRSGAQLGINEIAVEPELHPCLIHDKRHLDAATGKLSGDYIELTWRGGRQQILHTHSAAH